MKPAVFALAALAALSGCQSLRGRPVAERAELARIPAILKEACGGVIDLPQRDLTMAEISRLWATDRQALGECARRHAALRDALAQIEAQGR